MHNVLHADDTPHRIALGLAIGTFLAFTPTVGIQMIIALALAAAFKANKVVCVPMVWITNPVTIVPIYATCYGLGAMILGTRSSDGQTETLFSSIQAASNTGGWASLLEWSFWVNLGKTFMQFGAELWVGCLCVATVAGVLMYVIAKRAVVNHRRRRQIRLERRAQRRTTRRFAKAVPARGTSA